jgi:hypothetical protein
VARATAAAARLRRPSTIVCVVGEFKQGKSSLVNGLLGQTVCPVDDDLATSAITLVRHGERVGGVVRRREDGKAVAQPVEVGDLGSWITEQGNPGNLKGVERVEITSPSAVLRQGLAIVDTPGMGGLGAGHAAATLSFLPFADGLILVSDASAELSAPEIELLRQAVELCPTVLLAQTKIDLYPSWERIAELNRGHLARAGVDIPMVSVSSALRMEAITRKDRDLNARSRFPELVEALGSKVVEPAKADAAARSGRELTGIGAMVRTSLHEERALLSDPSRLHRALDDLRTAQARLEHLRGPGAKWTVLVGDRVTDLTNDVTHGLRSAMRTISRGMDEWIETLKSGEQWDAMTRELQTMVADAVTQSFVAVEEGRGRIHAEVAGLLQDEHLALPTAHGIPANPIDIGDLWHDKSIDEAGSTGRKAFSTGLVGLRGAQGGVMMFGMMGSFLPTAVATLVASNPVLLGAGAVFGGMQLVEDRKRKVTMRRAAARQQLRQFVDDVQFQVTNELTASIRELQRSMRDEFGARLAELHQTVADTAKRAQEDANRSKEGAKARLAEIDAAVGAIDAVLGTLGGAS